MDGVIGQPVNPAATTERSSSNRNLTLRYSQLTLVHNTMMIKAAIHFRLSTWIESRVSRNAHQSSSFESDHRNPKCLQ